MGGIVTHDGSASGDEPVAAINVTSLIDIMFCLLIAFMIATPLMNQEQIPVDIPHAVGVPITEEQFEFSVVSVDANGRVFVGALPLDADKARWTEQLASNQKIIDDKIAYIQGDRTASFEVILDVMIALKEAGVSEVGFVTNPRRED